MHFYADGICGGTNKNAYRTKKIILLLLLSLIHRKLKKYLLFVYNN